MKQHARYIAENEGNLKRKGNENQNQHARKKRKLSSTKENSSKEVDLKFTLVNTDPNSCKIQMEAGDKVNLHALQKQIYPSNKNKAYIHKAIGIKTSKRAKENTFITLIDKDNAYISKFGPEEFALRYLLATIGMTQGNGEGRRILTWEFYDLEGNLVWKVLDKKHNCFIATPNNSVNSQPKNPLNLTESLFSYPPLKSVGLNKNKINHDDSNKNNLKNKKDVIEIITIDDTSYSQEESDVDLEQEKLQPSSKLIFHNNHYNSTTNFNHPSIHQGDYSFNPNYIEIKNSFDFNSNGFFKIQEQNNATQSFPVDQNNPYQVSSSIQSQPYSFIGDIESKEIQDVNGYCQNYGHHGFFSNSQNSNNPQILNNDPQINTENNQTPTDAENDLSEFNDNTDIDDTNNIGDLDDDYFAFY